MMNRKMSEVAIGAIMQDRQISSRQMGIFEKYAETRQDSRYTVTWSGKTADHEYTAVRYYVAGKVNYKVTVTANNDSVIAELQAELNRIDTLMATDISDEEFDRLDSEWLRVRNQLDALR